MRYLLILLFITTAFWAQAQANSKRQLHFNFIGVKDGLPEGTVKALLQDKLGYMWIGTQTGIARYDGYNIKTYKTASRDSVPIYVKALYEDRQGRLWAGTIDDGIFLYDRSRDSFINYMAPFQQNTTDNIYSAFDFHDDAAGNIWIIFYNSKTSLYSLVSFNADTRQFKMYGKAAKGSRYINARTFTDCMLDAKGVLWVGSDNGIYHYDAAKDAFIPHLATTDSVQQKSYWKLVQDAKHPEYIYSASWYTTNSSNAVGLCRLNTQTNELTTYSTVTSALLHNEVWGLYQANDTALFVCTPKGLSVFNTSTQAFTNYQPLPAEPQSSLNIIKTVVPARQNGFWCETDEGVYYFDNNTKGFKWYTVTKKEDNGIKGRNLHNLVADKNGNLWFGADQLGLQWLNVAQSKFTVYNNNPNLTDYFPGGAVNSITQARDSTFWIGSDKGLYHWQPARKLFTLIEDRSSGLVNATAVAVMADKEGLIWFRAFGDRATGLYVYNPAKKTITNYRHKDNDSTSLASDNIQRIAEDSSGNIWLGTFGNGISRINKKTRQITRYPFVKNNGLNTSVAIQNKWLDDDEVESIHTDEQGIVYVGTNNGSVNVFDAAANAFTPVDKTLYKGLYCVTSLFTDSKKRLWSGTYMTGIFYREGNAYKKFADENRLLYHGSWGFNEDNNSNLWSFSPRGLTIINLNNNSVRDITPATGLPAISNMSPLYKAFNGQFLYGYDKGFVLFNPAAFAADTTTPLLHIENISFTPPSSRKDSVIVTFNKPEVHLRYNENRVTFDYTGLLYQNAAAVQYVYKLDGVDDDWINAGTDRSITYTNLSPGTYTFRVKVANSDGVFAKKEQTIVITIAPPWWQTWWAYLLYAFVVSAAIYTYVAYRSKKLKRENKLLEEKVTDRTKQLNASLEELKATQAQLIQSEKMASLGELTAGIAHEIQNPLNFVNNFSEVSNELMDEMTAELATGNLPLATEIADDIKQNLVKISHHGKRAESIVRGMLEHSRTSKGEKQPTSINALADEYLRLAYHGIRAKDKNFNAEFKTHFDDSIGKINIVPQELGRVLLNLFNNAFYAVNEKKSKLNGTYHPVVMVTTKKENENIVVAVTDNGNGIPKHIINKIFQPFFTTKPTGQGTGLGLSLSYDIIKAHGGAVQVSSEEGTGTTFTVTVPGA